MTSSRQHASAAPPGARDWPGFQVYKCGWWLEQQVERALEPLGLRGRHYLVLIMLGADGSLSQQQMATYMSLDPTRMVALIDELESRGLCQRERDQNDRRRYAIGLTAEGRRTLRRARRVVDAIGDEVFAPLEASEREQLVELMDRVMEPYWSEKIVPPRKRAAAEQRAR